MELHDKIVNAEVKVDLKFYKYPDVSDYIEDEITTGVRFQTLNSTQFQLYLNCYSKERSDLLMYI